MSKEKEKPFLLVVSGPTASGKSAVALGLAERVTAELVSADSVQIFKGFDIGSAKPSAEDLARVPQHLISSLEPNQNINAGDFCELAAQAISEICAREALPIVVGGSGLYIRSLLCGLVRLEAPTATVTQQIALREEELRLGTADEQQLRTKLYNWLTELDPETASRINPQDISRVKRALAVTLAHGASLATLQDEHAHALRPYRALVVVLLPERNKLYETINARTLAMLEQGLIDEVKSLFDRYGDSAQALGTIGYRHVCEHLRGETSYTRMCETLQRDTRRYAKRQLTWWRNQPKSLGWRALNDYIDLGLDGIKICDIPDILTPIITELGQTKSGILDKEICYVEVGVAQ